MRPQGWAPRAIAKNDFSMFEGRILNLKGLNSKPQTLAIWRGCRSSRPSTVSACGHHLTSYDIWRYQTLCLIFWRSANGNCFSLRTRPPHGPYGMQLQYASGILMQSAIQARCSDVDHSRQSLCSQTISSILEDFPPLTCTSVALCAILLHAPIDRPKSGGSLSRPLEFLPHARNLLHAMLRAASPAIHLRLPTLAQIG